MPRGLMDDHLASARPPGREGRLGPDWRTCAKREQRAALPSGPTFVSSTGPYGNGGLGRHLAELVETLRDMRSLAGYVTPGPKPQDLNQCGETLQVPRLARTLLKTPPVRFSPGWRSFLGNAIFDRVAARVVPAFAEHLIVFNGHALRHAAVARQLGYGSVRLVSANPHLQHVARQHKKAWRQYPIERPRGLRVSSRNLAEYDAVDDVYVSSEYAWGTFVDQGFPEERLCYFPLIPHERFRPRADAMTAPTFNVVYVGSLTVHKGVPLLVDAVGRLSHDDLRLVLVGSWGTRGMRRYLEAACMRDPRIRIRPGDPLPHLLQAGVCAHPSYEEGFGYAPAEALACNVPIIVSEDTGMKELIRSHADGCVIRTGDLDALTAAIDAAYRGGWTDSSTDGARRLGDNRRP